MSSRPRPNRAALWVRRYLPSEIVGTLAALLAALWAFQSTQSLIVAAVAATIAEGIGFYGVFAARQLWRFGHSPRVAARRRVTAKIALTAVLTARSLAVEFGPAELLDTLVVRPFLMYAAPALLGPTWWAWLLGKLAADLVFYAIAIISLETARPIVEPSSSATDRRARTARLHPARHVAVRGVIG